MFNWEIEEYYEELREKSKEDDTKESIADEVVKDSILNTIALC